jgi:hypothetical protein
MKYFIDTEFIEGFHGIRKRKFFSSWFKELPKLHTIQLISIGIYAEDGRYYYAISNEFNSSDADDWVIKNVISKLSHPYRDKGIDGIRPNLDYKSNTQIARDIIHFIEGEPCNIGKKRDDPQFYGYYSDYDWVVFCSLFGRMIELPKGFPMYCINLKQTLDEKVSKLENKNFYTHFHEKTKLSFENKLKLVKENNVNYPKQENEHDALADAKWNFKLYEFLKSL